VRLARSHLRAALVIAVVSLALAFGGAASSPVHAMPTGTDKPAGANCVGEEGGGEAEEAQDEEDDGDEGAAPTFSAAFYRRRITLDASLDGLDANLLPLAIEEVCDVPKRLAKQAGQLAGADAVALLRRATTVVLDGKRLQGSAATTALGGADTAVLKARLLRQAQWREDEEGSRVPTFTVRRIEITD
jgi:hypothetical protein